MNREEAIKILWQYDVNFEPHPAEKVMHAIDMAIEALQTDIVRCEDCKYRDPENKQCDCGALERQGRKFPVSDDYSCSYGERSEE